MLDPAMRDPTPSVSRATPDSGPLAAALGVRADHKAARRLVALADGEVATSALFGVVIQLLNRTHGWRKVESIFLRVGGRMTGRAPNRRKRPLDGAHLRELCEELGPARGGQDRAAGDS